MEIRKTEISAPARQATRASTDPHDDELEQRLIQLLWSRVNKRAALTIPQIARRLGLVHSDDESGEATINRRAAEALLEHTIHQLTFLVCSGSKGYWRPTTGPELDRYIANMTSRIKCLAARIRTAERQARSEGWEERGDHWLPPAQAENELFPLESVVRK